LLGFLLGYSVGWNDIDGEFVGDIPFGFAEGRSDCLDVGKIVGRLVGSSVGRRVGFSEG